MERCDEDFCVGIRRITNPDIGPGPPRTFTVTYAGARVSGMLMRSRTSLEAG